MSWSRRAGVCLALAQGLLLYRAEMDVAWAGIECPPVHDGKPLKDVELFAGPPSDKVEMLPEDGRYVVPQEPRSLWWKYPQYTLGCSYRGSTEMVAVVLPREVRVCAFRHFPHVDCH